MRETIYLVLLVASVNFSPQCSIEGYVETKMNVIMGSQIGRIVETESVPAHSTPESSFHLAFTSSQVIVDGFVGAGAKQLMAANEVSRTKLSIRNGTVSRRKFWGRFFYNARRLFLPIYPFWEIAQELWERIHSPKHSTSLRSTIWTYTAISRH